MRLHVYKYLPQNHKYLYPTELDECVKLPVTGYELQMPDVFDSEDIPKKITRYLY